MSFGPCMCGDTQCPSCGPAQGNSRCPACGVWDDDGGCKDPVACEKICEAQAEGEYRENLVMDLIGKEARRQGVDPWEMECSNEQMATWRAMSIEQLQAEVASPD
tara:strand:- start:1833 stop:2147 length:315 start_codon:yes stop_codon:yes gene_type:complete